MLFRGIFSSWIIGITSKEKQSTVGDQRCCWLECGAHTEQYKRGSPKGGCCCARLEGASGWLATEEEYPQLNGVGRLRVITYSWIKLVQRSWTKRLTIFTFSTRMSAKTVFQDRCIKNDTSWAWNTILEIRQQESKSHPVSDTGSWNLHGLDAARGMLTGLV